MIDKTKRFQIISNKNCNKSVVIKTNHRPPVTFKKGTYCIIGMEISNSMFALMAIVAIMGLVELVAVDILTEIQNAEAKGCSVDSPAFNASKGRCIGHGPD
mgnify:CR=1 FL=1